jgi:hypothetical protein
MSKIYYPPLPRLDPQQAIFGSRQYLAWLADPEIIGLDDDEVGQALHVATGYRPSRFQEEGHE